MPQSCWAQPVRASAVAGEAGSSLATALPIPCSSYKHLPCSQKCSRDLLCGHACSKACHGGTTCPPCARLCSAKCMHGQCKGLCTDLCSPCAEPCAWQCQHQVRGSTPTLTDHLLRESLGMPRLSLTPVSPSLILSANRSCFRTTAVSGQVAQELPSVTLRSSQCAYLHGSHCVSAAGLCCRQAQRPPVNHPLATALSSPQYCDVQWHSYCTDLA